MWTEDIRSYFLPTKEAVHLYIENLSNLIFVNTLCGVNNVTVLHCFNKVLAAQMKLFQLQKVQAAMAPTFSLSGESMEEIVDISKSRHSRGIEDLQYWFLSQYSNSFSTSQSLIYPLSISPLYGPSTCKATIKRAHSYTLLL